MEPDYLLVIDYGFGACTLLCSTRDEAEAAYQGAVEGAGDGAGDAPLNCAIYLTTVLKSAHGAEPRPSRGEALDAVAGRAIAAEVGRDLDAVEYRWQGAAEPR